MVRVAFACVGLILLAGCNAGSEQNDAASGVVHFVNSPVNASSMALRDAYVDFSFDYPAHWSQTPQPLDGTAMNYVRVAAPMVNGYEPYAFLVGYASGSGNAARDRASLPASTLDLAARFGAGLQEYQIVASGPARVAGYESYGWRFTARGPGLEGVPRVRIYGRGDLILPPGATRGVVLVSIATSRAGDIHNAAEVGERGTLRAILDSFRLARSEPAPPATPAPPAPTPATNALEAETPTPAPKQVAPPTRPQPTQPAPAPTPAAPVVAPPSPVPPPAAPPPPTPAPERPKQEQPTPPPPRDPQPGNGQ